MPVASTMVTNEGKSLFLEIPELAPAMTVHLRLHLEFADGNPFATDLFATVHELDVTSQMPVQDQDEIGDDDDTGVNPTINMEADQDTIEMPKGGKKTG